MGDGIDIVDSNWMKYGDANYSVGWYGTYNSELIARHPVSFEKIDRNGWKVYSGRGKWYQESPYIDDVGRGSYRPEKFGDCFNRNGGRTEVGSPFNNGGGTNAHRWGSGGEIQDFDGGKAGKGAITLKDSSNTAYWIHGAIWAKYATESGNIGGASGPMGWATSDEFDAAPSPYGIKGRLNRFNGGSIYWSPQYGAHGTYGGIGATYEAFGGTPSFCGFPQTDEMDTGIYSYASQNGWCRKGRWQRFEGADLYHHLGMKNVDFKTRV